MMFAAVNQDSKEKNSNEERNTKEKGFVDPDLEELRNLSEELKKLLREYQVWSRM